MANALRRPTPESDEEGAEGGGSLRWMLTYSDMITLLLALFIILFALSSSNPSKLKRVAAVLAATYDAHTVIGTAPGPSVVTGVSGGQAPGSPMGLGQLRPGTTAASASTLAALASQIEAAINAAHLGAEATVETSPQGLLITLSADYLFPPGHAAISPAGTVLIRKIGALLTTVSNPVVVLGATDSTPIHTARYPSNWQLGAMRAANVSFLLATVPGFAPERLLAVTTSKYHPVATNATVAGRAANRRVVLWVIRSNTLVTSLLNNGGTP